MGDQRGEGGPGGPPGRAGVSAVAGRLRSAIAAHEAGRLDEAADLYAAVLADAPQEAAALGNLATLEHQRGRGRRAEALLRRAVAAAPGEAMHRDNLGAVLESLGRAAEAVETYRGAEELDPGDPDRCFNLGIALARLGRHEEAADSFRRGIERAPGDADLHYELGNALRAAGREAEAVPAYRGALRLRPGDARVLNHLGHALSGAGRPDEAVQAYREALASARGDGRIRVNLARALLAAGQAGQAADVARGAAGAGEGEARSAARRLLVDALAADGRPAEALDEAMRALGPDDPDPRMARRAAALLRAARPARADPRIEAGLRAVLASGEATMQEMAAAAGRLIVHRHGWAGGAGADTAPAVAARDDLLASLLARAVNVDPDLERALTRLRRRIALSAEWGAGERDLAAGLAVQCFHNGYLWEARDEERVSAASAAEALRHLAAGEEADPRAVLRHALYAPLAALPFAPALAAALEGNADGAVATVVRRCLVEPLAERRLARAMPCVTSVEDPTSRAVGEQYEEDPYPRWMEAPAGAPEGCGPYLRGRFPAAADVDLPAAPRVLVAGCGTGQEAVVAALRDPGAQVTALDLSAASLAYGARMAAGLGLSARIAFARADLLRVGTLDRRFDVVESSGVLHHLADPERGWRALVDVLEPGGVMKVALYSRRARAVVGRARERIGELGIDHRALARLRREVMEAGSGGPLAALLDSEDFYAASSCRDLLFHVCEHRFDLDEVGTCMDRLGLRLLGLEIADAGVRRLYRRFNPADTALTDLSGWSRFEERHPGTFAGMYVLWCTRRDPR